MSEHRRLSFSGASARVQYHLLMGLFHLAVTRGLYGRFARGLGRIFNARNAVYLSEGGAPAFKIYLNDGYWTRFALYHHDYEPEVARVLSSAAGQTGLFCDLGANMGYWTLRAAPLFDRVIAVEAAEQTFAHLCENTEGLANVTRQRNAVHTRSGERLRFLNVPDSHASARLAGADEGADETVTTLAIDDLVPAGTAALIKLDVEGAEIAAFDGARRAIEEGAVIIYEDHGNDPACQPSDHLLNRLKISVYSAQIGLEKLGSVAAVRALKTDPFKGYNFVAARQDSPLLAAIRERFAISGPGR